MTKENIAVSDEKQSISQPQEVLIAESARLKAEAKALRDQYLQVSTECKQLRNACIGFKKENRRLKKELTEHKKNCAALEAIVDIDPLTGVYNRRYLDETAQKMIASEVRAKRSWGILMVDIDYFKNCNDTYGHTVGDNVLKNVAQMLQEVSRMGDFVIRYGGEEFCVLIFDVNEEELSVVAERYRTAVAATNTEFIGESNNRQLISVTISIGACFVPSDSSMDLKCTIVLADNALYMAKESGRNCVLLHDKRKHSCTIREERRHEC